MLSKYLINIEDNQDYIAEKEKSEIYEVFHNPFEPLDILVLFLFELRRIIRVGGFLALV